MYALSLRDSSVLALFSIPNFAGGGVWCVSLWFPWQEAWREKRKRKGVGGSGGEGEGEGRKLRTTHSSAC